MSKRISKTDRDEFSAYLRGVTDNQVQGVYDKEKAANRRVYKNLAIDEAARRGISLNE